MTKTKQRLLRFSPALLSAPLAICLAVPALADPEPGDTDAAFLASLQSAGITYSGPPDQVIGIGKSVCTLMGEGKSGQDVLTELQNRNPGLSIEHGSQFIGIAAHSYCPQRLTPGSPSSPGSPSTPGSPDTPGSPGSPG